MGYIVEQEIVYPVQDGAPVLWSTVIPPGLDHYEAIDEGLQPPTGPDDSDWVDSLVPNQIDIYYLGPGVLGKEIIHNFVWQFRYQGYLPDPGLRIWLRINDVVYANTSLRVYTGARWKEGQIRWDGINIPGSDWYTGPRLIYHESFTADHGEPPPSIKEEPVT